MARIFLVRHAAVTIDPHQPAWAWGLSGPGRAAAAVLAASLPCAELTSVACGPEPKMRQTAEPAAAAAGLRLTVRRGLREADRPALPLMTSRAYRDVIRSYLAAPSGSTDGFLEPAARVQRRITDAIGRIEQRSGGDILIVSGGLALCLFVAGLTSSGTPSVEDWSRVGFPAVAVVDASSHRLVSGFWSPKTRQRHTIEATCPAWRR